MLQLRHIFFGRALLGERPRQHELGLEHRPGGFDHAVEGGRHVADDGMPDPTLDVGEHLAGVAFEPVAVEGFGDDAELDNEVAGEVVGLEPRRVSRATGGVGRPRQSPMIIRASEPPMKERRCSKPPLGLRKAIVSDR